MLYAATSRMLSSSKGHLIAAENILSGNLSISFPLHITMNPETTFDCATFGFDSARIRETLSVLSLNAEHVKLAERIRSDVIGGKADALAHSCCIALARDRSFALIERNIGIECFTQTWTRHLQCYGQDFDTPKYFGERLAIAAAFVRAKISLSVLQLQHSLTQQALINSLSDKFSEEAATLQPLVDCILKLTSLDVYLSAEGYRLPQIDELRKALTRLRKETSHWHQEASTDQLTGLMRYNTLMETLSTISIWHTKTTRRTMARAPILYAWP